MRRDDLIRMRHMLDAAQKAMTFAAGKSRADLAQDSMLAYALVRAVEVIGEAEFREIRRHHAQFDPQLGN